MSSPTSAALPPRVKNLVGQVFGRLTVTSYSRPQKKGYHYWWCQCSCGKVIEAGNQGLVTGDKRSCGCLKKENATAMGKSKRIHGMRGSREYGIWNGIKDRTLNKNGQYWDRYGGRGVTICDGWRDSFEAFYADMGPSPGKDYSIDRIDNDGGYSKDNCRWATRKEQCRNRKSNARITIDGVTRTKVEWVELSSISPNTIQYRVRVAGIPFEQAIKSPVR